MGEAKQKTNLSNIAMNKVVKFVADHQNDVGELNAGQIREAIRLVTIGVNTCLTPNEADALHTTLQKDSLTKKILKQNTINNLKSQLAKLEAEESVVTDVDGQEATQEELDENYPGGTEEEISKTAEELPF